MRHEISTKPLNSLLAPQLDLILVDGSGSMLSKWPETVAALDEYRANLVRANINSHLIAATFSDDIPFSIQRDDLTKDCRSFTQSPLAAQWGGTPLFDAINSAARHLRSLDAPRATLLICTDGLENQSKYTNLVQAKALLDWCRAKGYQVIFLGCDFNNSKQAQLLGANPDTAIGVQKQLLREAAKTLSNKRIRYGLYGEAIHFTEEEQTQFGGLLAPPTGGA